MTVYILLAFGVGLIGWGVWMFRKGKRSAEADQMQEINDDARKATAIREQIDAKPIDDVRADLASRASKRVRRPF